MFNIGYLAGLSGLLLAWNSAILIQVTVTEQEIGFTAFCLKKTLESKPFYPNIIGIVMLSLCVIFSLIIARRTNVYLRKLPDSHLRNLPAKNALTYIDTLILFSVLAGSNFIKIFCILSWKLDFFTFDNMNLINCIISMIVDDIGVAFIFPIYIILKTKRYLPKLWDDSREIIGENNDFYATNPATVAPAPPGPQPANQQIAESTL